MGRKGSPSLPNKKIVVSDDTLVNMSTTYKRRARVGKGKETVSRTFDFVIKGMLISSTLLGAVIFNVPTASATMTTEPAKVEIKDAVRSILEQHKVAVSNLNMAVRVLETSLARGELSADFYDRVMQRLNSIQSHFIIDGKFEALDELNPVLERTDKALNLDISEYAGVTDEILAKRQKSIEALEALQDKIGLKLADEVVIASAKLAEIQNADRLEVNVQINGVLKTDFAQPAFAINGHTLVPMRAIFEELGAEVLWHQETQSVTAIKGDIEVKLTLNESIAYVNNQPVELAVPAFAENGHTLVPLRFISESLGAEVSWDGATRTAVIDLVEDSEGVSEEVVQEEEQVEEEEAVQDDRQSVFGVKVLYGRHNYGIKSQEEYDEVMEILQEAVSDLDSRPLFEDPERMEYYDKYLNGDRAENYKSRTMPHRHLTAIERSYINLEKVGITDFDEATKILKLGRIASEFLNEAKIVDGAPDSLADLLLRGEFDCDPEAYIYMALFDMHGYNTAAIAGNNHATPYINIDGEWYALSNGTIRSDTDAGYTLSKPGFYVLSEPTNGERLR